MKYLIICYTTQYVLFSKPYLEGYPGKLTAKNWAKRVKVSPDTAARDIKDLVEKAILEPQEGRVRDVYYGIRCSDSILVIPLPKEPLSD